MKKTVLILFTVLAGIIHAQTSLNLSNLPLQIQVTEGVPSVFIFSGSITSVSSRNPGVVSWSITGSQVTFTGITSGRTGLKIVSGAQSYYLGLRVNHTDGSMPGLPNYLSIASVSEDIGPDLQFWEDIQPGLKNKAMDIRYIYINGGPYSGWSSWGAFRPGMYARESLQHGLIPFYVYYNIPDGGESYPVDLAHAQDPTYMTDYFNNLTMFMDSVENVMHGELYGIILEPDFLGYMQQNASPNDPLLIPTAVNATTIATNAGNITTLVERINKTIQTKRNSGSNIFFGWQQNLWACSSFQGTQGVIRRTDDYTFDAGKYLIEHSAREATTYQIKAGVLSHGADFISIDKYGLDAMGYQNTVDPAASTWFWNNDHWNNYLLYAKTIHETAGKPIILWQLPVGHINESNYTSAYTGAPYADLPNTTAKYEDSSTDFFFGDTIQTSDPLRLSYFGQNLWTDPQMSTSGTTIGWAQHITDSKNAGIISAQFGAGVGISTDGIGSPPTDDHFWIQKVQGYYNNGTVPLDSVYAEGPLNPCVGGCPPEILFTNPLNNDIIYRTTLDSAILNFAAWDNDGTLVSLSAKIDGSIVMPTTLTSPLQRLYWTPPTSWGLHTLTVTATDNSGLITTKTIQFSILYADPVACGYPEWNPTTVYNIAGTYVTYNGLIFKNKYYTVGEMPYLGGSSTSWTLTGICPGASTTTNVAAQQNEDAYELFPNPTSNVVYVTVNNKAEGSFIVYDVKGAILLQQPINKGENKINIESLAKGMYILQISNDQKTHYKKIIKN